MTTIATDGRSIAADGQITGCGTIHSTSFSKLHRLEDGSIFGFTGAPFDKQAWIDFLEGRTDTLTAFEDSEALVLKPDGTVLCYNHIGRSYPQTVPAATGTGAPVALGAMLAGATASEAVKIATLVDTYSGGEVQELSIDNQVRMDG